MPIAAYKVPPILPRYPACQTVPSNLRLAPQGATEEVQPLGCHAVHAVHCQVAEVVSCGAGCAPANAAEAQVWRGHRRLCRLSPTVKGSRCADSMCMSCPFQPRKDTKALMMRAEPMVKQMANLEGARMMIGKNREKARTENSSPAPSNARNQVKFMVLGMLDCALQHRSTGLSDLTTSTNISVYCSGATWHWTAPCSGEA